MLQVNVLKRLVRGLLVLIPFVALSYATAQVSAIGFGPFFTAAAGFAALAGGPAHGAVTCTAATVTGGVGVVAPGTFVNTGCTVGTVNPDATAAYEDFLNAYDALHFNTTCDQVLTGTLAGVTLSPGVYCFPAAATLTGTLTLSGPADGVWIFKVGTAGTGALTATNFSIVRTGAAASTCPNVYWWVAEAATLTGSQFVGTILAGADITVTGGTLTGGAMAGGTGTTLVPTGAVTLTNSTIVACPPAGGNVIHVKRKCNQGVGNGPEGCDPGNSNHNQISNDELGGTPGAPGRKKK